jgi:thiamine pyrophosphokinase
MPAEERALNEPDVVVVASGPGPAVAVPDAGTVVAADGGLDRALALGLAVDIVIGDLYSVSDAALAAAEAAGTRVVRHPAAKDATDLELALDAAIALAPKRILVVGSAGGRLDHLLGSILLLADARYAAATVDASLDGNRIAVIRGSRTLTGTPGEIVTLLPVHGPAEKVSTSGLEYPLHGETLTAGTTRGVSNVFAAAEAEITVVGGCVVAVQPGPEREESL